MAGEDAFSEPILQDPSAQEYIIRVATPLYKDGQIIGAAVGNVRLDHVFESVAEISRGRIAESYLVDAAGLPLMSVDSVQTPPFPFRPRRQRRSAGGARPGVDVYENAAGVRVMGAYADLPLLGWGIVFEVEEERAIASALQLGTHLKTVLVYFIAGTIVVVVLVGLSAASFISRLILGFVSATLPDRAGRSHASPAAGRAKGRARRHGPGLHPDGAKPAGGNQRRDQHQR